MPPPNHCSPRQPTAHGEQGESAGSADRRLLRLHEEEPPGLLRFGSMVGERVETAQEVLLEALEEMRSCQMALPSREWLYACCRSAFARRLKETEGDALRLLLGSETSPAEILDCDAPLRERGIHRRLARICLREREGRLGLEPVSEAGGPDPVDVWRYMPRDARRRSRRVGWPESDGGPASDRPSVCSSLRTTAAYWALALPTVEPEADSSAGRSAHIDADSRPRRLTANGREGAT
jgi:hypothetical protein